MRITNNGLLPVTTGSAVQPGTGNPQGSFAQILKDTLGEVNKLQLEAAQASTDLALGKVQDVSEVMIAAEKANIALQLTIQVRNKVIEAYQEVMRMQV